MKRNNLLERKDFNSKPQKSASASDFDKNAKSNSDVTSVTFDTNLRMSNHARNKLQAITMMGNSISQKDSLDIALSTYIDSLSTDQKNMFDMYYKSLERRDVNKKNK
ncbi:DUF5388 domain-containing protein [Lactobacillaceae bacterium Melli_B3]